jgi:hypothetical protein
MAVKQVFNTSAELDFPNVLPTLDLDFANSKTLDPRITFTRASGGSYVGADGLIKYAGVNEARFDHDPETGESLGLLVEEARTNLFLWSEDFSQGKADVGGSAFEKTNNATISPDGMLTADKLSIPSSGLSNTNSAIQFTTITAVNGTAYTLSCFLKMEEMRYVFFGFTGGGVGGFGVRVDLLTGTIYSTVGTLDSFSVYPYPNGWYRVSVTGTSTGGGFSGRIFALDPTGELTVFSGSGGMGFYIWGAQLEQGAFPTSYIPTLGSTRTRAADNASITGKNFSEWYRQDEGTVYCNSKVLFSPNNFFIWRISDNNSISDRIELSIAGFDNNYRSRITFNNITQYLRNIVGGVQTREKVLSIFSYKKNEVNSLSNFVRSSLNLSPNIIPSVNEIRFGGSGSSVKWISFLKYFPKRLPNSQLQALTS